MKCSYEELYKLVFDIFAHHGCMKEQANAIAHSLLYSECTGDSAHGLKVVAQHIEKIKRAS